MRYLLYFLRKHYFYFLFLVLEVIGLLMFFRLNAYQNTAFSGFTGGLAGSVLNTSNSISDYFSLKRVNAVLAEDNARMHSTRPESYFKADTSTFFHHDTIYKLEYRYISAKVISNTTQKRNNFIMLNKGRDAGVEPNMGVILGNRVVGQVVSVSKHFSWIMSLLNKDSRISGKFLKNDQLVNIEWNGGDYRYGEVKEVPKHVKIVKGDTIISSGNSNIFPEGLLIGTIESSTIVPDENFNYATLKFSTDFNSLRYVEIIVDLMKQEKEDLQNSFKSTNPEEK